MPPRYDEAPEVAPNAQYPEVHHPPSVPELNPYGQQPPQHQQQYSQSPQQQQIHTPVKPEDSLSYSAGYAPTTLTPASYGYDQSAYGTTHPEPERTTKSRTICGCSTLVFILSLIIALLSAAVIGLAAGTGVEASRANDAESSLAALRAGGAAATTTVTAPSATATSFNALDRNCTSNPSGVSGTTYSSDFFTKSTYTIYCNQDTPLAPILSLFVANIDDCMDACSSYSYYMPSDFPNATATNQSCAAVSFIPAWTNRTFAVLGGTPGNCYLKPGPQNETALTDPNNGSETHAAVMVVDS